MASSLSIQTSAGVDVSLIAVSWLTTGITSIGQFRVHNSGTTASTTCDLCVLNSAWTPSGGTAAEGQEAVTEQWIEASDDGVTYAPIGGDPSVAGNVLALTPPAGSASTNFWLRVNVPVGAATTGRFYVVATVYYDV